MSFSDIAWIKYPAATLALVVVYAILGLPTYALLRSRLPRWCLLLTPMFGIGWAIFLVSWYARLGWELPMWLADALVLVAGAISFAWLWRSGFLAAGMRALRSDWRAAAHDAWGVAFPWIVGLAAVTAFMLPVISSPFATPGFLTSFTFGNADIGAYIGEATNVQRAGFDDAGLYYGWNAGSNPSTFSADQDHTGANALLAYSGSVLGQDVWKIAQIVLMLMCATLLVAAVTLVRWFLPQRPRVALAVGTLASTTFMVWYLAGNYFLAQIITLALIMTQLSLVIALRDRPFDWRLLSGLALMAAATWLTSPELQTIFFLLAGGVILADYVSSLVVRAPGALGRLVRLSAGVGISVIAAGLITWPFMEATIARSKRVYDYQGGVGWALDPHNNVLILLGYPEQIGSRTDLGTIALALAGIAFLAAVVRAFVRRDRIGIAAAIFCFVLAGGAIFGAHRWGWAGYQGWKLIMTLAVPFIAFVGVLLTRIFDDDRKRPAFVVACAAIVAVNVLVGSRMWDSIRGSEQTMRYASMSSDLATFLGDRRVQDQRRLNIYIPSLFGTMIAPAMYEQKAAMSSPSYFTNAKAGESPYACSLVDATMYKKRMGTVAYANHGYLLVNTPRCS